MFWILISIVLSMVLTLIVNLLFYLMSSPVPVSLVSTSSLSQGSVVLRK